MKGKQMLLQGKTWEETWGTVDWGKPWLAVKQVSSLLENGTPTEIPDAKGETVFMKVAQTGNIKISKMLLKAGANINAVNNEGKSTLILIIEHHLHRNVCNPIKTLIKAGIDVNLQDKDGNNALMHAVMQRAHAVVQLLIDHKADVNKENHHQETALTLALKRGDEIATVALLNAGASSRLMRYVRPSFKERINSKMNARPCLVAKQSESGKDYQNRK